MPVSLPLCCFNSPQNFFGSYLSSLGVSSANAFFPAQHALWYFLIAAVISGAPLLYMLLACANAFFASRHVSVNHGAITLPHLLGLRGALMTVAVTTPACIASARRNASTCYALSELLQLVNYTMLVNFA